MIYIVLQTLCEWTIVDRENDSRAREGVREQGSHESVLVVLNLLLEFQRNIYHIQPQYTIATPYHENLL